MADLPTVDLSGIEVFSAGDWNGDKYSTNDLDSMVAAFDQVGFQPTVKAGHADGQEDEKQARKIFGAPALGYVNRLYRQGKKLLADFTKVPRRFADLIKTGAYSRVSSEIYWSYANHDGKKFPRVLKSVAFLGADVPAITSLKEIEALYSRNDAGGLYAYDDAKNEFRLYEASVIDPAPVLNRYKEEGTFVIKPEDGGFCVYDPQGEKVKTWATLEEAKGSLEGYNYKVEGEYAAGGDLHVYYVRKQGDEWCVFSKAGKRLGCHPTEEKANAQLRAIEANKQHARKDFAMTVEEKDGEFCVVDDDGNTVKKYPTKEEAEKYMASMKGGDDDKKMMSAKKSFKVSNDKGGHMTEQELDEKIKEAVEKATTAQAKEYERQMDYRVHKAREDTKAEASKAQDDLREEIRKLQSEKRSERIEGWLKRMKAEGKIAPVEESKVRALREWIPDESEGLKYFSLKAGKTEEHTGEPAELFESLFDQRPSMFRVLSKDGGVEDGFKDDGQELDNAGAEVDRRAKLYQQKQSQEGTKVDYAKAIGYVLKQDPELARKYNSMDRQ